MDINRFSLTSVPYTGQPLNLGLAYAVEEQQSQKTYQNMTETEKEHLIMRCKDAKDMIQKQKTVEELAPHMNLQALNAETGDISTTRHPW